MFNELGLGLSLQADDAHGTAGVAWIMNTGDDLGQQGVGFWLIQGILRAPSAIPLGHMAEDKRLEAVGWVSAEGIKWGAVAGIAEVVRELDDLWHASEVLAQHDVLSKTNFGIAVEATLG